MNFRKLHLADKELLERFKQLSPKYNCDFCFSDLYLWRNYYQTEIALKEDILFLRLILDNEYLYFIPLGNTAKGIDHLIEYTRKKHQRLRIISIEEQDLKDIDSRFSIVHIRSNDDYIYSASALSTLQGKDYKAKRNFVNSFKTSYDYTVKPIQEFNLQEDMSFLDLWGKENPEEDRHSFLGEREAIYQALKNLTELGLDGLILKSGNAVVGLTLGTYSGNTFITHFEKVDYTYRGASQMINYLMANYVKDKADWINREEDLGIAGLRKAKLSYRPQRMIKSYTAYLIQDYPEVNNKDIIDLK